MSIAANVSISASSDFDFSPDDPFAAEHVEVRTCIDELLKTVNILHYYYDFDLKEYACAKKIVTAKPPKARRYLVAAVMQVRHWDQIAQQFKKQHGRDPSQMGLEIASVWYTLWPSRQLIGLVVSTLVRRKLPLERDDLLLIADWLRERDKVSTIELNIGGLTKTFQQHGEIVACDQEISAGVRRFALQIRQEFGSELLRYSTALEQLITKTPTEDEETSPTVELKPAPQPAPAGCPAVLYPLKKVLGIAADEDGVESAVIGPDEFPLRADSPYAHEHQLLTRFFEQLVGTHHCNRPELQVTAAGKVIFDVPDELAAPMFLAAAERHMQSLVIHDTNYLNHAAWQSRYVAAGIIGQIPTSNIDWSRNEAFDALLYLAMASGSNQQVDDKTVEGLLVAVEKLDQDSPLTEGERYVLALFRVSLIAGAPLGNVPDEVTRVTRLISDGASFCLSPGETWTDSVNSDFASWSPSVRAKWSALFNHMLSAIPSRPSAKWLQTATKLINDLTPEAVQKQLLEWLPSVSRGRSVHPISACYGDTRGAADTMKEENAITLRGLLWLVPLLPHDEQLTRCVTDVTISAYKKVPGVGPRAVKVGNAGVYALSELASTDAVGQLAKLKVRVKFGSAQKEIEKAFNKAADALGLPREEIEEMGVPSYGLEDVGSLSQDFDEYCAKLSVTGSDAQIKWFDSKGKALKSVPAKVKAEFGEDLKELNQTLKDVKSMLPAQRDRIDSMFLLQKSWPIGKWRERYLNHPLVGTIARRLIWCVDGTPALFLSGEATDSKGNKIPHGQTAEITLWHPVGRDIDEIVAWRNSLEERGVTQPFKQAHREVYLLTAAEESTEVYSNRFAAHVIRQHQFNALCGARGWRNKLRLMVDDEYPPASKELPQWGLRAEFWVEGIGDNYGVDTNETGTYHYLATDQVRFYRMEAAENAAHAGGGGYVVRAAGTGRGGINEPMPLDQIPPLVISEVMRDVDLFVGVASVGNDPNWQDGGPQGRYRDYWNSYSFGELAGTAATRKQVLERLIPRLKIAERCSFSERFLVVRGNLRTYKIHFGSSNILMEPNDQYLCIVPDARIDSRNADLFLPFEGDRMLSIIISKALLLAADDKIKDPTILRQIRSSGVRIN